VLAIVIGSEDRTFESEVDFDGPARHAPSTKV
jgi:hypothetical protein